MTNVIGYVKGRLRGLALIKGEHSVIIVLARNLLWNGCNSQFVTPSTGSGQALRERFSATEGSLRQLQDASSLKRCPELVEGNAPQHDSKRENSNCRILSKDNTKPVDRLILIPVGNTQLRARCCAYGWQKSAISIFWGKYPITYGENPQKRLGAGRIYFPCLPDVH